MCRSSRFHDGWVSHCCVYFGCSKYYRTFSKNVLSLVSIASHWTQSHHPYRVQFHGTAKWWGEKKKTKQWNSQLINAVNIKELMLFRLKQRPLNQTLPPPTLCMHQSFYPLYETHSQQQKQCDVIWLRSFCYKYYSNLQIVLSQK